MTTEVQTQVNDPAASSVIDLATPRRPTLSITEAAEVCQVGRKTITRRLDSLAHHGADKDAQGVWRIPIEALEAVGLRPGRPTPPEGQTQVNDPAPEPMVSLPLAQVTQLQNALSNATTRIGDLERTVSIAETALRALDASPATIQTQQPDAPARPPAAPMTFREWRRARKAARAAAIESAPTAEASADGAPTTKV